MTDKIILDLDGTLAIDDKSVDYVAKPLNLSTANAATHAREQGMKLSIFTSRRMRTYKGDLEKINALVRPEIEQWLVEKNVFYDDLIVGKPWCGFNGWYVDDRNLHVEEFQFRYNSPYAGQSVDVVVPFYNEEENVVRAYRFIKRLERLFDIQNGSQIVTN